MSEISQHIVEEHAVEFVTIATVDSQALCYKHQTIIVRKTTEKARKTNNHNL